MNPFSVKSTNIEGCFVIQPKVFSDHRGKFVKVFNSDSFSELNLMSSFEEEYYSVSKKGVLRGLHFQTPPDAHIKLVTCIEGKIIDVVVDLRKKSSSYLKVFSLEINSDLGNMLYVPEGLAHGFYTLSEEAIFLSMNSKKYSPECDNGIKWNSIDFDWPDKTPIVSEKDDNMPLLKNFNSPF